MGNIKLIALIEDLLEINIDAYHSYTHAINGLDIPELIDEFIEFRTDHYQQIESLSHIVHLLGGKAPLLPADLHLDLQPLYEKVTKVTGMKTIIKSMHTIETLAINRYESVLASFDSASDSVEILQHNLKQLNNHIKFINKTLIESDHLELV